MNTLSKQKKEEVLILAKRGCSFREIAKRLHINRQTISQYAKAAGITPRKGRKGGSSIQPTELPLPTLEITNVAGPQLIAKNPSVYHQSACEPHRDWIEAQVKLERNGMSIYQDLVEQFGFTHKYDSVKVFVRGLKKTSTPEPYARLEFPPGEEAQVDYGEGALTIHPDTGKYKKPRLFVMTLKKVSQMLP